MNLLPALELARIRADAVKAICDKTCTIRRDSNVAGNTVVFDSKGGSPDNLIDIADNVPCAMVGLSAPTQQFLADQPVGIDSRTLHTPYGTDIQANDEVVIDGTEYKVLSPHGEKTLQIFTSVVILRKTPL
jgi:hypothetical protein